MGQKIFYIVSFGLFLVKEVNIKSETGQNKRIKYHFAIAVLAKSVYNKLE